MKLAELGAYIENEMLMEKPQDIQYELDKSGNFHILQMPHSSEGKFFFFLKKIKSEQLEFNFF